MDNINNNLSKNNALILFDSDCDFENFKSEILKNIDVVEIDFEVGYCYKRLFEDELNGNNYWHKCYYFLKGLAHYYKVACWR